MFSGYYICKIMVVTACFLIQVTPLIQAGVTLSSLVTKCKILVAGLEPAILDWYSHCGVNKLGGGGLGDAPPGKFLKLEIASEAMFGPNHLPVVSVAREAIEQSSCQK